MKVIKAQYGGRVAPLYISLPTNSGYHIVDLNAVPEAGFTDGDLIKDFEYNIIILKQIPKTMVEFTEANLEELFGSCSNDLEIEGT
jgi:hypothetical protein